MKKVKKETIKVTNMSCYGCEETIKTELTKLEGIKIVKPNYKKNEVTLTYDEQIISMKDIEKELSKIGYGVKNSLKEYIISITVVIIAFLILTKLNIFNNIPDINNNTDYIMLFFIGLLTSFHCIFMCGGINLAASTNYRSGILYNLGRLISYTLIGGIVGLIGSVITFDQTIKDLINVFVGTIMILMSLQILRIITLPRLNFNIKSKTKAPFIIGLLNGLMPCGPLQAMQLYALTTGSFIKGAFSMFLFASGTIPLMLLLSFMGSFLSKGKLKSLKKVSAIFILVFGIMIIFRSIDLPNFSSNIPSNAIVAKDMGEYQLVEVRFERGVYRPIVVEKNKKVVWKITLQTGDLNGCNDEIYIPEFNLTKELKYGENIIEFTPNKKGIFKYTCWMNMLQSSIYVVDNI